MPSAKNLNEAIEDLKAQIAADGFTPGMIADIAEEWDVHPAMLTRKFEEATGKPASEYAAPAPVDFDYPTIYNRLRAEALKNPNNVIVGNLTWETTSEAKREQFMVWYARNVDAKAVLFVRKK